MHLCLQSYFLKFSDKQLKYFIHTEWPNKVVHNVSLCGTNWVCLSKKEQRRLVEKKTLTKRTKPTDKFQHDMLHEANLANFNVEEKDFYGVVCKKHNSTSKNIQTKNLLLLLPHLYESKKMQ